MAVHKVLRFKEDHVRLLVVRKKKEQGTMRVVINQTGEGSNNTDEGSSENKAIKMDEESLSLTVISTIKSFDILFKNSKDRNLWHTAITKALHECQAKTVRSTDGTEIVGTRLVSSNAVASKAVYAPPSAPIPLSITTNDIDEEDDDVTDAPPPLPFRAGRGKMKKKASFRKKPLSPSVRRAQRKYGGTDSIEKKKKKKKKPIKTNIDSSFSQRRSTARAKTRQTSSDSVDSVSTEERTSAEERNSASPPPKKMNDMTCSDKKRSGGKNSSIKNNNMFSRIERSKWAKITTGSPVQKRNHALLASSYGTGASKGSSGKTNKGTPSSNVRSGGSSKRSTRNVGMCTSNKAANDSLLKYYERMKAAKNARDKTYMR